jgi:DNA-directed RNA polymerase specialized sigma24 family protein
MGCVQAWRLSVVAWDRLLWQLAPDRACAARRYELLRAKLIRFFARRGCALPEDCADVTFDRVARRLDEGVRVAETAVYLFGAARLVALEQQRRASRPWAQLAILQDAERDRDAVEREPGERESKRLFAAGFLDSGLRALDAAARRLLIRYYEGDGASQRRARAALARDLGISAGVLRVRVHRLRARLEGAARRSSAS